MQWKLPHTQKLDDESIYLEKQKKQEKKFRNGIDS